MKKGSPIRYLPALFILGLFATLGAAYQTVNGQTDDAALLSEITSKIADNKSLASQRSHINVVVINAAVKLQGWTDDKGDYNTLYSIVSKTKGVRVINVNNFRSSPPPEGDSMRSSGGCVGGTKPCGDICIPAEDSCTIKN